MIFSLVEDALRWIGGPLGVRGRRAYYRRRLKACGERLTVAPGVTITAPEWISLGDDVWLDQNVTLIAGPPASGAQTRTLKGGICSPGEIMIGTGSHLGIGTIVQGHGGVVAGNSFTTSAGVKIYSFSNDPRRCRDGTMRSVGMEPAYLSTPVEIGRNVWLGLNAVVIGGSIGANSFSRPGAVLFSTYPDNSIIGGNPAERVGERFRERDLPS